MENKIYNDDVERIVSNAHQEKRTKKISRLEMKRKKMGVYSILLATIGLVFSLFGAFGWMVAWLAFPLFFVFVMASTFLFGRFFENGKCRRYA